MLIIPTVICRARVWRCVVLCCLQATLVRQLDDVVRVLTSGGVGERLSAETTLHDFVLRTLLVDPQVWGASGS